MQAGGAFANIRSGIDAPSGAATATPSITTTVTPAPSLGGNMCAYIRSPGFWKDYAAHMSDAQYTSIINTTPNYAGTGITWMNKAFVTYVDQTRRYLVAAELNAAWNGNGAAPGPSTLFAQAVYANHSSSLYGQTVSALLTTAFNTVSSNTSADLQAFLAYAGGDGQYHTAAWGEASLCSIKPLWAMTATGTGTASRSVTPSQTGSPSLSGTRTPSQTGTHTASVSGTPSQTGTPTGTPSGTPSQSGTPAPASGTPTNTITPTNTGSQAPTPSGSASVSGTPSQTRTGTGTPSQTASHSGTPSHSGSPSVTPSNTPTPTQTPTSTSCPGNLCALVQPPGFWANYAASMSTAQFAAILNATQDYGFTAKAGSQLTVDQAVAMLANTSNPVCYLLAAELNAAWDGANGISNALSNGRYLLTTSKYYNKFVHSILSSAKALPVFQNTPTNADLYAAVVYMGSTAGTQPGQCLLCNTG